MNIEYRLRCKLKFLNYRDQSKAANKLRLQKLKTKIEFVDEIVKETKGQLASRITKNAAEYKIVLKNLIIQVI